MKREKVKRNRIIISFTVLLIPLIVFTIYFILSKDKIIEEVLDYNINNINLSVFVDKQKIKSLPDQKSEIIFERLDCSSEDIFWFNEEWKLILNNLNESNEVINCEIYFSDSQNTGELAIDLVDGMIPISFDENGKTIKANIKNADNNWYNYNEQKWANMVLVSEKSRDNYQNSEAGIEILEEDILTYFVWIPRYKYQLFNTENNAISEQTINIEFEKKDTLKSNGEKNYEWLTHPAFTFGSEELNGFWVGKFMTNPDPNSTCNFNANITNCNVTNITPRIKPNSDSWRYINVSNLFTISQYLKTNPMYGINKAAIDSHMIKNMEWGAVAYLSQSEYGKRGNNNYEGRNKEIYNNNYRIGSSKNDVRSTLTGCSSGTHSALNTVTTCHYAYPNLSLEATGASTTGTVYGIYDMNGASSEYVMGNMHNRDGNFFLSKSGTDFGTFGTTLPSKYYDAYEYSTSPTTHYRGHLGDATREIIRYANEVVGGWYSDASYFPDSGVPWMARGGHSSSGAWGGIFRFIRDSGGTSPMNTSRIVLVKE